jgi:DNA-binding SARP family transcriptional activator/predicted ATPase
LTALRIEMLGHFCLSYRGKTVTSVDTPRLQSLLAYLVLKRGDGQSRQHLSFLFWPDSSESQARTNLRQLLHHLRIALPDCDTYLEISSRVLRWKNDTDFSSDVDEFERAVSAPVEEAGSNMSGAVRERLESAVRLYRGDLLPGFYEEWVQAKRQLLRDHYISIVSRLVTQLEGTREYAAAISYGERLLSCDPLSEARYKTLIRLHALNGDRAGVTRAYQQCVTVLRRELNVEPGISTRKLYEEMAQLNPAPVEKQSPTPGPVTSRLPLVGRRRELNRILELWRAAGEGSAVFVLVSGESGIGKTRLTEEVMSRAGQGARAVYARSYASEHHLAYAPVTHWLRSEPIGSGIGGLPQSDRSELVRVLPELLKDDSGLLPPQPLAEGWHRRRFFEILARAILRSAQPLLLVLDDLHWCDPETLEWLEFLVHFDAKAKLLVLGTARLEELGAKHAFRPILNRLVRDNVASEIVLSPLDREETAALARQVSHEELDSQSLGCIYRDTEGNPLFVVESILAGSTGIPATDPKDNGSNLDAPAVHDAILPPKVRAVLASRLAQLSPAAHDVAGVAATIGRAFSFELLLKASALSETELIPLVDELWERRIIRRAGHGLYDFSHDKLREVAYDELGPGRKGLLHRSVAEALEASGDVAVASSQVARHFERAGMPSRAIPHYVVAGRSSRTRYADNEAIGYFTKALQLLGSLPQTRSRDGQELEILILLGAALVSTQGYAATEVGRVYDRARLLCEFLSARQPYFPVLWGSWVFHVVRANFQTAREFATRFRHLADGCGNTTLIAAGHFMMGCTLFHVGKPAEARQEVAAALESYDPQHYPFLLHEYGPELGVFCQCYFAHCLWILGHPQESIDRISSALARARDLGDPFSVTLALVYSAMLHQFLGDAARSRQMAEEAAALCNEYGFKYYQAWPPIIRGWALAASGQAVEGAALIRKGMDALRQIQSQIREPYYLGLLAFACRAAGRADEAMKHLRDAFGIIEKGGETWAEAELHRIKGDLLQDRGDSRGAELSYQRAYSLAGQQDAGAIMLRAAIALIKLWTAQGKRTQAQKLSRQVRAKFTGLAGAAEWKELESLPGGSVRQKGSAT